MTSIESAAADVRRSVTFWPRTRLPKKIEKVSVQQLGRDWTWQNLKDTVLSPRHEDWNLFVEGPLSRTRFFLDALRDPDVRAMRSGERGIQSLSYHSDVGPWINIVSRDLWGRASLESIKGAYELCDVGMPATPAALGDWLMRGSYSGRNIPRPPWRVWDLLHDKIVGGRVDLVRQGEYFDKLWEYDLNGSYLAQIGRVPGGRLHQVFSYLQTGDEGFEDDITTSFRKYLVFANRAVSLGPLPVRLSDGRVIYPTEGGWEGWYWREEIDEARALGWDCSPYEGVYWTEWNDGFETCQTRLWDLRQRAGNSEIGDVIKLATVAGIGRFASDSVVTQVRPGPGLPYVDPSEGPISGLEEVSERKDREGLLIHIASYVWMKGRLALWKAAFPLANSGQLVATDYDAVYTTAKPVDESSKELGGWKAKQLHNVTIPAARTVLSDEKVRMPGIPLIGRESK